MARKKRSVYQAHTELFWQQYSFARSLAERFPDVLSITIDLTFIDPDHYPYPPGPRKLTFTPEQKAFFHIECPYHRECVRGGFDFSEAVREAMNSLERQATGSVTCQGWQDQERIGKNQCMLKASYHVLIS